MPRHPGKVPFKTFLRSGMPVRKIGRAVFPLNPAQPRRHSSDAHSVNLINEQDSGARNKDSVEAAIAASPPPGHDSLVEILWRRRATVASCVAVGLAVGAAYLALVPKSYTAVSRLYVERTTPNVLTSTVGTDSSDNTSFLYMQKETLESTPVLGLALEDKRMQHVSAVAGSEGKLTTVRDLVNVEVGRKDGLLNVTSVLKSPDDAKLLTSIIVDAYVEYHSEGRTSRARSVLTALEAERKKANDELAVKTHESEKYQQEAGVLPAYEQWSQGAVLKLNDASSDLAKCRIDVATLQKTIDAIPAPITADQKRQLAAARARMQSTTPSAEDEVASSTQLLEARSRLAYLQSAYLPNHPSVQSAQTVVNQLNANYIAVLERRLIGSQQREATLQVAIADDQKALIASSTKAEEYRRLIADVTRIQTLIETLDNRIREYSITGDADAPSISVLEPSHIDDRETSPKPSRTLALAGLIGLALGSLAGFVRDRSQLLLRVPADVAAATLLPTLGTYTPTTRGSAGSKLQSLCETIARRYREAGEGIAVAITSADSGDGRTSVAKTLATTLAKDGLQVLLLNADPNSRGSEDAIYPNGPGLSEMLFDSQSPAVVIDLPPSENLKAIGFGRAEGDLAADSNAFEDLLAQLRVQFQVIVIDCAAITAEPAGRMAPAAADLVVHVVRGGPTSRSKVRGALDQLACVGVEPLGAVLALIPTGAHGRHRRAMLPDQPREAERENTRWPKKRDVFGVGVSATTYDECERLILAAARRHESAVVTHLAVHPLVTAVTDPKFRQCIQATDIVAPDGQPVRWALNVFHRAKLPDRVYGPELMLRLCREAQRWNIGVYFYGGTDQVLAQLEKNLADQIPGFRSVGSESPPFRPLTSEESDQVVQRINASGAGLVFIGLGCPKQDYFAFAHRDRINAVQLCVGAAFDFHAGVKPMAPRWMQRSGMEWAFRFATEPRRLWKRYMVTNSLFMWLFARRLIAGR